MKKLALALLGLLAASVLWAQEAGVTGRVLSKTGRQAVENARVCLYQGSGLVAETRADAKGNFKLSGLPEGNYTLIILAPDFLENHLAVALQEGRVKNVFNIMLQAVHHVGADQPETLFGSTDIVNNLSRQFFPQLRYGTRGLQEQDYYLAGVHLDGETLSHSGLAEALRENRTVTGAALDDVFGGLNGTVSIDGTASAFRRGLHTSLYTDNAQYHLLGQASYSTGQLPGGWVISADAAAHTPNLTERADMRTASGYLGADRALTQGSRLSAALLYAGDPLAFLRYSYAPSHKINAFVTALGQFSRGREQLHLSGGVRSQLSAHWSLMGGADARLSLADVENRRLEAWAGALYQWRRWAFQAAFQSRSLCQSGESLLNLEGKIQVQYQAVNSRLWASVGGIHQTGAEPFRWAGDINWSYNTNGINVRTTAYALSREDGLGYGAELGFKLPVLVVPNLFLQGLACMGAGRCLSGGVAWSKGASYASADVLDTQEVLSMQFQGGHSWTLGHSVLGLSAGLKTQLSAAPVPLPRWNYLLHLYYRI